MNKCKINHFSNEVSRVKSWAANNNLQLNCAKSHEIVFRSRRLRGKADQPAPPWSGVERVEKHNTTKLRCSCEQ